MPATEQTWRDQKVMHIVFGASAVVMMIATLWLIAKDHNREWKEWQLQNRKKEARMTLARRDLMADQFSTKMETFDSDIVALQSGLIDESIVNRFVEQVHEEDARLEKAETDLDEVVEAYEEFTEEAEKAQELVESEEPQAEGEGTEVNDEVAQGVELVEAREDAIVARSKLLAQMQLHIREAKRRENQLVGRRKFVAADRTAAVSELGLMIGGGEPKEKTDAKQEDIDGFSENIAQLTEEIAEANRYRTSLESIVKEIDEPVVELAKERGSLETELSRLNDLVYKNTSNVGEWVTRWPVLDALYDGNVRIDQIWLPDMTINYNFSQVARFDRCKTCHVAISQTAAGTADQPAYPTLSDEEKSLVLQVEAPASKPDGGATLRDVYGVELSDEPLVGYTEAVLVHYVLPKTPAALAGLQAGDTIVAVGDVPVYDVALAETLLLKQADWGEMVSLEVHRGLEHPFTGHPRLDLYLTDSSPHPEKDMGCTICHDGQGSGTSFMWTSHTPNDAEQHARWTRDYGWFDNHHWIFPMKPARFSESNCTKCHYDKGSLEPSDRFPEPPADKLVSGWSLAEKYGCFGCHEINGYDGPDKRVGPDVRLEPNYAEVSQQILLDQNLSGEQRTMAEQVVERPDSDSVRQLLLASIKQDVRNESKLSAATHKLADGLKDVEVPGTYRKVGPSLRYLASKVDAEWLYSWIKKPADFRPSTRMPQFFGLHEHLQDADDKSELEESLKYEPIEIRALTDFLLANSDKSFDYVAPPEGVTEPPSAERGKWLFQTRGCLACHTHEAFPGIDSDQGPELSRISSKFTSSDGTLSEKGTLWLYSWLKQPHKYHVRTKMPDLYLDPIDETDATGQPTGKVSDPAADIAVFLLGTPSEWKPTEVPTGDWSEQEVSDLADLAVEWLSSDAIPTSRAREFIDGGIPDKLESKLKADEKLLLQKNFSDRVGALKTFVAKRTISKYGCFGCHDIPGFEDAKPIGAALAEWGRKDSSKLAFENIHKFLEGPGNPNAEGEDHGAHGDEAHASHGHLNPTDFEPDTSYFITAINGHARDGFVWQKLRMPRSYDYKTTRNKGFNERLRMPLFPFDAEEREQVITFVLGLVNEPPAEKFVYQPSPEQKAIVEGRQVLERFNCAGCHTMRMETWDFAFEEDLFGEPSVLTDYPFLEPHFSSTEIAESLVTDERGFYEAHLRGLPAISEETGKPELFDEDGLSLDPEDDESDPYYRFTLWEDALLQGEQWLLGLQDLMIPASREDYGPANGVAHEAWGGDLARYLFPHVIEKAKESNPQVKGAEAWGWLPPPLMAEGEKVQPDWLHGFLMDPIALRPAVVMRMPNFHMSSEEASKLVDYFAASSNVEFPYEYKPQQRASYLAEAEQANPERMNEAMNIVTNGNYCVKCHSVADFDPQGDVKTFGPNLANVYRRLRPEYVQDWVANPKRILPYTGMPVNIIYNPDAEHMGGVAQNLYHGSSLEQLQGMVDLLMNFDVYTRRNTSIGPLVEKAAAEATESANASQATAPRR